MSDTDVVEAGSADPAKHLGIRLLPEQAEESGEPRVDAADMDRLIEQHLAAEVAGDPDGSVAMYTDDVEHDVVGAPHGPLTGRDAGRGFYEQLTREIDTESMTPTRTYHGPDFCVTEHQWTGTVQGTFLGIPGHGRRVLFRMMEWALPARGWAPLPHVHPSLTEEYEVLEGLVELLIGREWRLLRQGDHAAVRPGSVHTFRVGSDPARVRNVHRPARDFEPYIERLCRTANERRLGDLRGLRSLLYIAMLVDEYPEHSRAAGRLLNATASHIAALARVLRLRPA